MSMHTLQGLGWQWRENGVVICVQLSGCPKMCVFVPLNRVWHEFSKEFAAAGVPLPMQVGAPITVSGLFSSIAHAASSVAHAVTHNPVTKAAQAVTNTAKNYAQHAISAISKIPVIGPLANATASLMTTPLRIAEQLAQGGRIDRVALASLKSTLANVKTIAPYAQAVVSMVPGVGQGVAGAIGAATALASGQSITAAMEAAVKGALPGGPLAQAAFSVASDAMHGKPITQIALNALPLPPAQKNALTSALAMAKDLAAGKNVSHAAMDAAMNQLPTNVRKAVQVGTALGHAKSIQSAAGQLASIAAPPSTLALANAARLSSLHQAGVIGAQMIQRGQSSPAAIAAVKNGLAARSAFSTIMSQASQGHPMARQIVGAMQSRMPALPPAVLFGGNRPRVGAPFRARYSTAPAVGAPHHREPSWMYHPATPFHTPRRFAAVYAR